MSQDDREELARLGTVDVLLAVRTLRDWLRDPPPPSVHHALRHQTTDLASGLTTLALFLLDARDHEEHAVRILEELAVRLELRLETEAALDLEAERFRTDIEIAEREAEEAALTEMNGGPQWVGEDNEEPETDGR